MTCYSILQPYNAYSYNIGEPFLSDCKPLYISDKFDTRPYFDKDCINTQKFCFTGDHRVPNLYTSLKHHHVPSQGDYNPCFKHYFNPCHGNQYDATWCHAHDSGNTIVLNMLPYSTSGKTTGMRIIESAGTEVLQDHVGTVTTTELV